MEYAGITFPTLKAGDKVKLTAAGVYDNAGATFQAVFSIREDSVSGTVRHQIPMHVATDTGTTTFFMPFSLQDVYTAPSDLTNKTFVLSGYGPVTGSTGSVSSLRLDGIRFKR